MKSDDAVNFMEKTKKEKKMLKSGQDREAISEMEHSEMLMNRFRVFFCWIYFFKLYNITDLNLTRIILFAQLTSW